MEDSAEVYLRSPREVSTLSFVLMCVCWCRVFVFTCVSKLHIFYHLDNSECNMYAYTLERWSKHVLKDPPPKDLNDQEPFEQRFSVDEGNKVRE